MPKAQVVSLDKTCFRHFTSSPSKSCPIFPWDLALFLHRSKFCLFNGWKSSEAKFTLALLGEVHRAGSRHKAGTSMDAWAERSEQCFYLSSWYRAGGQQRENKNHKPWLSYWGELRWSSGGLGNLGHSRFRHWPYLGQGENGRQAQPTALAVGCLGIMRSQPLAAPFSLSLPLMIYFLTVSWELLLSLYLA